MSKPKVSYPEIKSMLYEHEIERLEKIHKILGDLKNQSIILRHEVNIIRSRGYHRFVTKQRKENKQDAT